MSGSTAKTEEQSRSKFPSPRGDKLCPTPVRGAETLQGFRPLAGISCVPMAGRATPAHHGCFRPLAGISCVIFMASRSSRILCFRPLAGISCVGYNADELREAAGFRPLAGISCVTRSRYSTARRTSFRPLAGISCVWCGPSDGPPSPFPSPRGDKLCLTS